MRPFDFPSPVHPELGPAISREERLEALRETLRHDPRCWLALAAGLALLMGLILGLGLTGSAPVLGLVVVLTGWLWLGRQLALPRVRARFEQRVDRRRLLRDFKAW